MQGPDEVLYGKNKVNDTLEGSKWKEKKYLINIIRKTNTGKKAVSAIPSGLKMWNTI